MNWFLFQFTALKLLNFPSSRDSHFLPLKTLLRSFRPQFYHFTDALIVKIKEKYEHEILNRSSKNTQDENNWIWWATDRWKISFTHAWNSLNMLWGARKAVIKITFCEKIVLNIVFPAWEKMKFQSNGQLRLFLSSKWLRNKSWLISQNWNFNCMDISIRLSVTGLVLGVVFATYFQMFCGVNHRS